MNDKEFCKHFGHLEDHQFKGYNNALGVKVESKEHYKKLLSKGNYVPYDVAKETADKAHAAKIKPYTVSNESREFVAAAKLSADRKGNVKLSDRQIDALVARKAIARPIRECIGTPTGLKGGFSR